MTNSQQQAQEILDRLAFVEFDRCSEIDLNFNHLPAVAGIYAIRHRTDGLLYLGKTKNLPERIRTAFIDSAKPRLRQRAAEINYPVEALIEMALAGYLDSESITSRRGQRPTDL